MPITMDQIKAMSAHGRANLYVNAMKQNTEEALRLVALIEASGLPFSECGSLKQDDPLCKVMMAVVRSDEGRNACITATEKLQPAIAGVDPMLAEKFGADYGKHNMATHWAGRYVADVMREAGYKQVGKVIDAPSGCVARSGELYAKR